MVLVELLKTSVADDEPGDFVDWDSSMTKGLQCAVRDVLSISNVKLPSSQQVEGELRMLFLDSTGNDDQHIERSLPADSTSRKYSVDQLMAFTKNLCRLSSYFPDSEGSRAIFERKNSV